jgi:hypothetical protein
MLHITNELMLFLDPIFSNLHLSYIQDYYQNVIILIFSVMLTLFFCITNLKLQINLQLIDIDCDSIFHFDNSVYRCVHFVYISILDLNYDIT